MNRISAPILLIALGALFAVLAVFAKVSLLIVGLGAIAAVFVIFVKLEIGVAVLTFSAVADGVLRTMGGFVGSYWDDVIYALVIIALIWRLAKEKRDKINLTLIWWAFVAFLLVSLVSGFLSNLPYTHILTAIRSVLQGSIIFFVIINAGFDEKTVRHLTSLLILCAVTVAGYGLWQRQTSAFTPQGWLDKKEFYNVTRATSFLGSPNATAGFLILALPVSLGMSFKVKRILSKLIFIAFTVVIFLGLYATLNRASWIGLGLGLVVFAIASGKRWLVTVFVVGLIGAVMMLPDLAQRFSTFFSDEFAVNDATYGRSFRWETALSLFYKNPFFGVGPGGFGGAVSYGIQAYGGLYSDNYYLLILSNYGLFGILSFLFLIVSAVREAFKGLKAAMENERYLVAGLIGGMVAFVTHMMFENLWDITPLIVSFWICAGLAASFAYGLRRKNEN